MLLMANSVSVLLPAYRRTLMQKYRGENVHFRAHGILSARPEYPDFSKRGDPVHKIVAFGKWGTYKRLELLMEAFALVSERIPDVTLVVAGSNHPMTPGYVESVAERYAEAKNIQFTGYVPEEAIAELFGTASVLVMQTSFAPQTVPQAPQFRGSSASETQVPAHAVLPASHTHAPPLQISSVSHGAPQPPQ
jgi:glycosyltransferase involved in cell wall biosynthesis